MIKTKLNTKKIIRNNNSSLFGDETDNTIILTNKKDNIIRLHNKTDKYSFFYDGLIKNIKIYNLFIFVNNDSWLHIRNVSLHKISKKKQKNLYRIKFKDYYQMFNTTTIESAIRQNKLKKINKILNK